MTHLHLYRPSGPDRVAVVMVLPSSSGQGQLVQVARGKDRKTLGDAKVYGPLSPADVDQVFARELDALKGEGFLRSGLGVLLTALEGKSKRQRALAAQRLGWMREPAAVEALLAAGLKASEEASTLVDALGELGDERAIAFCRTAASKKLLSRRRSGVEALRKLGDAAGLADAKNVALERLPQAVRAALAAREEGDASPANVAPLVDVVAKTPQKDRGLAIDTLYEMGSPLCVAAAREAMVRDAIDAPHMWRYAKSVFKRSMLRHDVQTFGWLAHGIEVGARLSKGTTAAVKSGLDGETRPTRIFGRSTQAYVARASWRYLRRLAKHRPGWYAFAAAETLVCYTHDDEVPPPGLYGSWEKTKKGVLVYAGAGVSGGLDGLESDAAALQRRGLPLLHTPSDLAAAIGIPIGRLRWLTFHRGGATLVHYHRYGIPKKDGGIRAISAPKPALAKAQAWILASVLAPLPSDEAAHGFVHGRSIVSNAAPHVGRAVVVNLDLKDFFPTLTFRRVKGLFASLGYGSAVATCLALLCTEPPRVALDLDGRALQVALGDRVLPQGACTSPAITNLVCRSLDRRLTGLAAGFGFAYTRYADDLTFSRLSGDGVGGLLHHVRAIVADEGFVEHPKKTHVMRRGRRQEVTGVTVNAKTAVSRRQVRELRAILHNAARHGLASQNRDAHPSFAASLRGRVAYVAMVDPSKRAALEAALARALGKG